MKRQQKSFAVAAGIAFLVGAPALSRAAPGHRGTELAPRGAEKVVPLGSRIPRWEEPPLLAVKQAVGVMHDFAKCIAKKKTVQAQSLLATLPESTQQDRLIQEIVGKESSCLSAREMRLKSSLFRGAIAEALYDLNLPVAGGALTAISPRETFEAFSSRLEAADEDGLDVEDKALLVGRWLAYCSAHENPTEIVRFLETKPSSTQEASGLRSLVPLFSRCLLQGQTLQVDQITMRALLAEAIYARRISEAAHA